MAKFSKNSELLGKIAGQVKSERSISEVVPEYNTTNVQGLPAYAIETRMKLVSKLFNLKLEDQFYKSSLTQAEDVRKLIDELAKDDPKWVAKAIIYARAAKGAMRSVNQFAAACLAKWLKGQPYAEKFFSVWNPKEHDGGCINYPPDMSVIQNIYNALYGMKLSNAMKRAFRKNILSYDTYLLAKYKQTTIDISKLTHPNPNDAKEDAIVEIEVVKKKGKKKIKEVKRMAAFDAIIKGENVYAETMETADSEAGQMISEAVKSGQITESEGLELSREQRASNALELLKANKLPIGKALKSIRSLLLTGNNEVINLLCDLISNPGALIRGKIMPYDLYKIVDVISSDHELNCSSNFRKITQHLELGIERALPNLAEVLTGDTCIAVDCSGSMTWGRVCDPGSNGRSTYNTTYAKIAFFTAAMLAKAVNADIIRFRSFARYVDYNPNDSVFTIAEKISENVSDGTSLSSAFDLMQSRKKKYDRIFVISDCECNQGNARNAYANYVKNICDPYIYMLDIASYGTKPIDSGKVHYLFGYTFAMFDMVKSVEINPNIVMKEIDAIKL